MSNLESNVRFAELMIGNAKTPKNCDLCGKAATLPNRYEIYDVSGVVLCADCARPIDEAVVDLATGKTTLPEGAYFGDCPKCGKNDGYLNVNRNHYFLCKEHKTCWGVGSNLFSSWKDEDESIWEENIKTLSECRIVKDWHRWNEPRVQEGELVWVEAKQAEEDWLRSRRVSAGPSDDELPF
jgi:hypothetical protein